MRHCLCPPPSAFGTLAVYAQADDQLVDMVGTGPGQTVHFDGEDRCVD